MALHLDRAKTGSNIAAKMAMIAMTTSNSINVNPARDLPFAVVLVVIISKNWPAIFVAKPTGQRHQFDVHPERYT